MNTYSREHLAQEIVRKKGIYPYYVWLSRKPDQQGNICMWCSQQVCYYHENFGSGTATEIFWVVDAWFGVCHQCKATFLWVELKDDTEIDRQRRTLLIEACERELREMRNR